MNVRRYLSASHGLLSAQDALSWLIFQYYGKQTKGEEAYQATRDDRAAVAQL